MIKQALKSRTVQYGMLLASLSVLQGFVGFLPASPVIQAVIGVGIASGVVVLRFVTTQAITDK